MHIWKFAFPAHTSFHYRSVCFVCALSSRFKCFNSLLFIDIAFPCMLCLLNQHRRRWK